MTLLNTVCNLGGNWPATLALWAGKKSFCFIWRLLLIYSRSIEQNGSWRWVLSRVLHLLCTWPSLGSFHLSSFKTSTNSSNQRLGRSKS